MIKLAAMFLLLSGIASLTYQVAWVRLLGLSIGSTSASISTVLAAFFLGLAIGSYLAERITRNRIDNLNIYIIVEAIIGISSLCLLPVLLNLDALMATMPQLGSTLGAKFFVAMALLLIPTVCMGATFPVMASILIRRHSELGVRVGQLYSLNTAGAVLGAALAGFLFIPNWGLDGAVYIAFCLNLVIVISAFLLNKHIKLAPVEIEDDIEAISTDSDLKRNGAPLRGRALVVLFATGLVSIATEVGWTKYLSIFTGTTIYGFAAILTIFLTGIAVGSWFVKSHVQSMRHPALWMAAGLLLLGVLLLLTRAGLSLVPPVYEAVNHFPVGAWWRNLVKYALVFILLFPPTLVLGALFPINLKLYCGNLEGVRAHIGKAYAVNTFASIVGSLLAGFWIIPKYGTDSLLTVMAIAILLLPALFVSTFQAWQGRVAIAAVALLAMSLNWALPHISYQDLIASVQYDDDAYAGKKPKFLFLKEGKAGVISMVTHDDRRIKLQNNGLNESFIDLEDVNNVLIAESMLGLVPYMLHDNPKSAFVVGFGGGITTRALTLTQLESIKVVELEPAVVEAGRAIVGGEIPALQDPRVTLAFNDARNTLLLEDAHYDLIVSQPSHPWLARASNLFTQEFFQIVSSRLNSGGIYGQWVNLFNMDATTLRSIFKAFYTVFPEGFSFANLETGDLLLFGSHQKVIFDFSRVGKRIAEPKIKAVLNRNDLYLPRDLFWYFALSREEALKAAGDTQANSDLNILSEVRLSALNKAGVGAENPYDFLRANYSFDVIPYVQGDVADKLYSMADYFFQWDSSDIAEKVANQLDALDAVRARGIRYEALWQNGKYKAAKELFNKHDEWPARTYAQQARVLIEEGESSQAWQVSTRIQDHPLRRATEARLLYMERRWPVLGALKPQSDEERLWQLVGLSHQDMRKAGKALAGMVEASGPLQPESAQYRVLTAYYGLIGDEEKQTAVARKLVAAIEKESKHLITVTKNAVADKDLPQAQRMWNALLALQPEENDKLRSLRRKVENLRKESEKPA